MLIRRIVPIVALSALALAGCASRGNEVLRSQDAATVNQVIVDGQTTREQVLSIYGQPSQTTFQNEKSEVWTYVWSRATAQGQNFIPIVGAFARGYDVRTKRLVIVFNENNIVARHSMLDNSDAVKTGFLDSGPPPTPGSTPVPPAATGAAGAVMAAPSASSGAQDAASYASNSEQPAERPPSQPTERAPNQSKRNRSASSASPASASPPSSSAAAGPSLSAGVWLCVIDNIGNKTNPRFTLQFVIGSDNAITVTTYENAPATIVQREPLIFTAVHPRGSRQIKFTWRADNSMTITGPNTSDPTHYFYNEGTCTKAS